MEPGTKLAEGRTAEIFPFGEGKVLKLFRLSFPRGIAEQEYHLAKLIADMCPLAPGVFESVMKDDRFGFVMERVEGDSLLREMLKRPWRVGRSARLCARILREIHGFPAPAAGLPDLKARIADNIRLAGELDETVKTKILERMSALPGGEALYHGDFHPDNILVDRDEVRVIDWLTAAKGPAVADIARTSLLLGSNALPPGVPLLLAILIKLLRRRFLKVFRSRIRRLSDLTDEQIDAWTLPLAAARLAESIAPEEKPYLLGLIDGELKGTVS